MGIDASAMPEGRSAQPSALPARAPGSSTHESRVLMLAPASADADAILDALAAAGIHVEPCRDGTELVAAVGYGAGAVMVAEESLSDAAVPAALSEAIAEQAAWSDLPVLLLSGNGASRQIPAELGNVTVLARPTPIAALVSATQTALRARQRQYDARAGDQRKDEFLSTLAHELRNPLAPLRNAVGILKRDDVEQAVRARALDVLDRQCAHLTRLMDDLLDIARITRGRVHLQRSDIALADVLQQAVDTCGPLLEARGQHLHVQLPSEPVRLHADATRIAQCVSNLLDNAAKYSPTGAAIELSAQVQGDSVTVQVRDSGIGIAAETMRHLFDVFAPRPAAAKGGSGLGMGLAIVKTFIEMHGGSVSAHSDGDGKGSTFVLRIPQSAEQSAAAPVSAPADELPSVMACSVLIVDDNVDSADSLGEFLSLYGHRVQISYTGQAGWDAALRNPPDVAILDIGLPDMTGLQLAQRFRGCPTTAQVRLIALSGWGQRGDLQRSAEAGFDHHLVKPADLDEVLAAVGSAPATDRDASAPAPSEGDMLADAPPWHGAAPPGGMQPGAGR